jgi:hypothetical protein
MRDGRCEPPQTCPPDTIRLPNGECCPRQFVHNGRCCLPTLVSPGCEPPQTCPPGQIKLPNGQCCPREQVHDGRCVPPSTCPPGQIQLPNGTCCPREWVRDGQCQQPVPRINVIPHCPRGQVRLSDGGCGHPPIVRIPGRLHVPHKLPRRDPPKRERAVKPNWKPQHVVGNVRLNTFRPTGGFGGMGGGGHRGR